jgi:AcrR family transcriptional regulator
LPQATSAVFEPRKSPVQARSTASVEAMLEATIQVLLQVGKEQLTTTRVAARAGVSVGTLYQYFPNKSALLQAVLRRHLDAVSSAIVDACTLQRGKPLEQMATALMNAFLAAKMQDANTSAALYAVSSDVDGAKIARQMGERSHAAIVRMIDSAAEPLHVDTHLVATMLYGVMVGVSRRLLEAKSPQRQLESLRQEMIFLACAYLKASAARTAKS